MWGTLKSICKVCLLKWKLIFLFSNFPNGNQMDENFANMRSLIQILDQTLYDTIQKNGDFSHFYFCYRYVWWYCKDFEAERFFSLVFYNFPLIKGQLKSEWIYEVSIFQISNKNIVKISALNIFKDYISTYVCHFIHILRRCYWEIVCQ